jgi:hypothetical protein
MNQKHLLSRSRMRWDLPSDRDRRVGDKTSENVIPGQEVTTFLKVEHDVISEPKMANGVYVFDSG